MAKDINKKRKNKNKNKTKTKAKKRKSKKGGISTQLIGGNQDPK